MIKLFLLLALLLATPAWAQYGGQIVGTNPTPPTLQPLDDSDPAMKHLTETFFETVPCGPNIDGLCPEALQLLRDGGNPLATYLIRQFEASLANPYPSWTYLNLVGRTESEVAYQYLSASVQTEAASYVAPSPTNPQSGRDLMYATEALGKTRDVRVLNDVAVLLQDPVFADGVRVRAINAVDRVQAKHGPQPQMHGLLQAEAARTKTNRTARIATDPNAGQKSTVEERIDRVLRNPGHTR